MELIPSKKITEKFNFLKEKNDKKPLLKKIGTIIHHLFGIFIVIQSLSLVLLMNETNHFKARNIDATPFSKIFTEPVLSHSFDEIYKQANKALISGSEEDNKNVLEYLIKSLDNPDKNNNLSLNEQKRLYNLIEEYKYTNLDDAYQSLVYSKDNCMMGINSNLFFSCIFLNMVPVDRMKNETKHLIDLKVSYMEKKLK